MSNRGLQIDLALYRGENNIHLTALDCPVPPAYSDSTLMALFLRKLDLDDENYACVRLGQLWEVRERSPLKKIHVRQNVTVTSPQGVFPCPILQSRNGTNPDEYPVSDILVSPTEQQSGKSPARLLLRIPQHT